MSNGIVEQLKGLEHEKSRLDDLLNPDENWRIYREHISASPGQPESDVARKIQLPAKVADALNTNRLFQARRKLLDAIDLLEDLLARPGAYPLPTPPAESIDKALMPVEPPEVQPSAQANSGAPTQTSSNADAFRTKVKVKATAPHAIIAGIEKETPPVKRPAPADISPPIALGGASADQDTTQSQPASQYLADEMDAGSMASITRAEEAPVDTELSSSLPAAPYQPIQTAKQSTLLLPFIAWGTGRDAKRYQAKEAMACADPGDSDLHDDNSTIVPIISRPTSAPNSIANGSAAIPPTAIIEAHNASPIAANDDQPDDLRRIKGIGEADEKILKERGFASFNALANLSALEVKALRRELTNESRLSSQQWIEQAAMLSQGQPTRFAVHRLPVGSPFLVAMPQSTKSLAR